MKKRSGQIYRNGEELEVHLGGNGEMEEDGGQSNGKEEVEYGYGHCLIVM